MNEHGSAGAALEALPEVAAVAGEKRYQVCAASVVEAELELAQRTGAKMLCYGAPDYPTCLMDIPDPAPILWAVGNTELLSRAAVGIVGARNASSLGLRMARKLAADLGEHGQVIVSGLARGVDTAVHTASLQTGTIAVMAGGVDVIYPRENMVLGEEIAKAGLLISEAPMGLAPQARHFPRRNRIISGLSRGVVVVEAAAKSGSLITAEMALEQGREVFAVPGHPFDPRASGCNRLIRDGATLVRGSQDILSVFEDMPDLIAPALLAPDPAPKLDIPTAPPETRSRTETRTLHQQILDRLGPSPLSEDQLIRDLARPVTEVAGELTSLEMDGAIERGPGGVLSLKTGT